MQTARILRWLTYLREYSPTGRVVVATICKEEVFVWPAGYWIAISLWYVKNDGQDITYILIPEYPEPGHKPKGTEFACSNCERSKPITHTPRSADGNLVEKLTVLIRPVVVFEFIVDYCSTYSMAGCKITTDVPLLATSAMISKLIHSLRVDVYASRVCRSALTSSTK